MLSGQFVSSFIVLGLTVALPISLASPWGLITLCAVSAASDHNFDLLYPFRVLPSKDRELFDVSVNSGCVYQSAMPLSLGDIFSLFMTNCLIAIYCGPNYVWPSCRHFLLHLPCCFNTCTLPICEIVLYSRANLPGFILETITLCSIYTTKIIELRYVSI